MTAPDLRKAAEAAREALRVITDDRGATSITIWSDSIQEANDAYSALTAALESTASRPEPAGPQGATDQPKGGDANDPHKPPASRPDATSPGVTAGASGPQGEATDGGYDGQTLADTAAIVASGETTTDNGTSYAIGAPRLVERLDIQATAFRNAALFDHDSAENRALVADLLEAAAEIRRLTEALEQAEAYRDEYLAIAESRIAQINEAKARAEQLERKRDEARDQARRALNGLDAEGKAAWAARDALAAAQVRVKELEKALEELKQAAVPVSKYGAQLGSQWTRLNVAIVHARAALAAKE